MFSPELCRLSATHAGMQRGNDPGIAGLVWHSRLGCAIFEVGSGEGAGATRFSINRTHTENQEPKAKSRGKDYNRAKRGFMDSAIIRELRKIVGKDAVLDRPEE